MIELRPLKTGRHASAIPRFTHAAALVAALLAWPLSSARAAAAVAPAAPSPAADLRRDAVVEAVERALPSVVNIATEEIVESRDPYSDFFREFWEPYYRRRPRQSRYSLGSGVIIDEAGYVVTNLHVVQRARKIWIQLADGREFEARPIVGTSRSDVAVLRLVTDGKEKFHAVKFARDDDLLLGETVLALGNPFGLGGSVSRGILSSKNRRPPRESESLEVADWLQTDAAINPGSSGGPLLNLKCELIGLNVAVYREGQGIGFAIPVKQVTEALSEVFIPEVGPSDAGSPLWFGARIRSGPYPLTLTAVLPGSPAEKAGLQPRDQIVQVNGRTPRDFIECTELLCRSPQQEATLQVARGGERLTVKVQLLPLADLLRQKLGLKVREVTSETAARSGLSSRDGLLVDEVEARSPAARAELKPGYVLAGVDDVATPDLLSAAAALGPRKPGETVELTILARQRTGLGNRLARGTVRVTVR
jgi:S1-C subfamily serine protease